MRRREGEGSTAVVRKKMRSMLFGRILFDCLFAVVIFPCFPLNIVQFSLKSVQNLVAYPRYDVISSDWSAPIRCKCCTLIGL